MASRVTFNRTTPFVGVATVSEGQAAVTAVRGVSPAGVGVKAALPLGLCLLPAFVLLGIVPVVAGMLGTLGL